jgi:APA family basic amino acid/polyamine antiporter
LLVINAGGVAAVAVTFARYFVELTGVRAPAAVIAAAAIAALTVVNCFGLRSGSAVQSALMALKIAAIAALIAIGAFAPIASPGTAAMASGGAGDLLTAMVPVLFAYGGWQTGSFLGEEVRDPRKNLPRALLLGVLGVIALYLGVNAICLYFAMARDGLFFRSVAATSPRTGAPVVAVLLQGAASIAVAFSGRYEQILGYVVSMDWIFFGLTAVSLFVLRRRDPEASGFRVPGHPVTTGAFAAIAFAVAGNTIYRYPGNTVVGVLLVAAGVPAYGWWKRSSRSP